MSTITSTRSRRAGKLNRTSPTANVIAFVFCVLWAFPIYWMVKTAFTKRSDALSSTPQFFPTDPTLANFHTALFQAGFFENLRSSVIVVVGAVVFAIVAGLFASAALSRFRFSGRRTILVTILLIQMIPGGATLIPQYFVFNATGLLGTYFGLILAYVSATLPFSIWMMRSFFLALPKELEEAAQLDGATTWQVLTRILFPLVLPGVLATSVFTFMNAWNDYLIAYTFMKDQSMYTLPVWLASFSSPITGTDVSGQMAASVLFSLPVVVLFVFLQRKLVTGMTGGAVKG
ncbi:carbohydrate ABC transporter permease [Microbacterium sp. A82]|uniref:carbohydrate ABC transporter permease n=1 Tax=Microbacterium sp. A82 TaxID=3450452 RepID=UPI003F37568C